MSDEKMRQIAAAGIAGLIATIPQTLAMEVARRLMVHKGNVSHPGRFPPRQVLEAGFKQLGGDPSDLSEPAWQAITTLGHFGYGTSAGMLYPLMPKRPVSVLARGTLFGLAVWAGSYFALLPAMGIKSPQGDHPIRKNLQLVVAHLAWGVSVSYLFKWWQGRQVK